MKLQQLRYIWEVANHDLNVSATAQSLYTSQPGVSKQIRLLEDELGVEIFARSGRHLTQITPAGKQIIKTAGEILRQVEGVKQIAQEFSHSGKGHLSIATTHVQAQYVLPPVIKGFVAEYPDVVLHMHEGAAVHIGEMVSEGVVEFAIATEALDLFCDLIVLPCYQWNHSILVPKHHPLTKLSTLTLESISKYPLVSYVLGFTGRSKLDEAFANQNVTPKIAFTATDTDVIKTYVRMGFGVGIVASMAYNANSDSDLVLLGAKHLFKPNVTSIAFRRGAYLRGFMYDYITKLAPHLTKDIVLQAIQCQTRSDLSDLFADIKLPVKESC